MLRKRSTATKFSLWSAELLICQIKSIESKNKSISACKTIAEKIPQYFEDLYPVDIAEIIKSSPANNQEKLFAILPEEIKPDVLAELEADRRRANC